MGGQHGNRLAEHGRLGLDSTNAPAKHTDTVDHCGVGIRADHGIGKGVQLTALFLAEYNPGQVFEVDLVDNSGVRGNDLEVGEGLLPPAQEGIAFLVAVELQLGVDIHGVEFSMSVNLYRVINHQFGRRERVDSGRITAEVAHGIAHGRQIDDSGHPGEILQQDPRRRKSNFLAWFGQRVPGSQRLDVIPGHIDAVLMAQQVFE